MKSFASFASCILALTISIAQAQTPQESKPRRLTVSGGVLQGTAIKQVTPPYPPIARAARAAGKVEVQVTISEKGKVIEAIVISGHPLLRDASLNAAKQWVFKPTELDSVPVKVQGILSFNFTLDEDDPNEPDVVPRNAEEYLARGKARLAKDDAQGAIADFTKAIELDQQSFDAYFQRLIARVRIDDPDGVLADANKLIEINPRSSDAYFARGNARMLKLDLDGSIADFSKAIELNPQSSLAWSHRGIARKNKGDLDGSIADYTKAIELEPRDAMSYANRGVLLMSKGDLDGAIADFTKGMELESKSALFYASRGMALLLKGKEAEAQRDFDRCLELDQGYKPALERQIKAIKEQRAKPNR
jgi:TonB family protein